MFEFGSTKCQRQINTANPDVRNRKHCILDFLALPNVKRALFHLAYSNNPQKLDNVVPRMLIIKLTGNLITILIILILTKPSPEFG